MKKAIATLVAVAALLPAASSASSRPASFADVIKARAIKAARAYGINANTLLRSEQTMRITRSDGTVHTSTMRFDRMVEMIGRAAPAKAAEPGFGGTPAELNVGDLVHAYLTVAFGADYEYSVTKSAVVPSTPAVMQGSPLFMEYGGPLYQVKGGGWSVGLHQVGTAAGSNVDTGAGGPYVPVQDTGFVSDTDIDFVGHALSILEGKVCFFGFCFSSFGLLVGDGVTLFDNTTGHSLPVLP